MLTSQEKEMAHMVDNQKIYLVVLIYLWLTALPITLKDLMARGDKEQ